METVHAISRQSAALPSIGCLDIDKIKREEADYQRKHTSAAMVSPSFNFNCPPPPYTHSHPLSANAAPAGQSQPSLISPPGSRRTSGDEQPPSQPPRQSLPSILEALGGSDPGLPYPTQTPGPPTTAPGPAFFQTPATTSADSHRRTFTSGPPDTHRPYSQPPPQSPFMSRPPPGPVLGPPTPTSQPDLHSRPPFAPQQTRLPSLHPIRTGASPVSTPQTLNFSPSHQVSPRYDAQPQSAPPAPYSYPQYGPPSYQYPTPTSGPVYTPSTVSTAPPRYQPSQAWPPAHDSRNGVDERGETVKRHLDSFELEASLNEIAECSGKMLEFSREYGARAHPNQRSGLSSQSIPHLQTVDELMSKSQKLYDSLARIRDVVLAQNAIEDQMKDPGRSSHMGYPSETNGGYGEKIEGTGGFANGEGKKRRGRAAPPGRCHSCNRAETPEWRRGPDGARTLCNACGLHYAKLTRKMGANKAAIGTSNLRPKSLGPGSPPA